MDGILYVADTLLHAALGLMNHSTGALPTVPGQLTQPLLDRAADPVECSLRVLIGHAPDVAACAIPSSIFVRTPVIVDRAGASR
ncbi:MAG: hypothetical protein ABI598_04715 [Chloroflexota bacterium]